MAGREYYNVRHGHTSNEIRLSIEQLKNAFFVIYIKFDSNGYFQKYLGHYVANDYYPGLIGDDLKIEIYLKTGLENLWPIYSFIENYSEVELFTIIEFLHDYASKPTSVHHGEYGDEFHVTDSDDELGRSEYRESLNKILINYKNFELSTNGEILEGIQNGFELLFNAPIPTENDEIIAKIINAQTKFRRTKSSIEDRRDALRELADVLEMLRPKIKTVLMSKDENDIFNIANNFGIRHFNPSQKSDYDKPIWHSWMFYCYLATIHASLRLIEKQNENG